MLGVESHLPVIHLLSLSSVAVEHTVPPHGINCAATYVMGSKFQYLKNHREMLRNSNGSSPRYAHKTTVCAIYKFPDFQSVCMSFGEMVIIYWGIGSEFVVRVDSSSVISASILYEKNINLVNYYPSLIVIITEYSVIIPDWTKW